MSWEAEAAARRARRSAVVRLLMIGALSPGLAGCVVPYHMHVTEGVAPQGVDTNVRFRTTYYFRAFDYCWNLNAPIADGKPTYQHIIPETDTLYRYRMTGKAASLASQVKFESGVLPKTQIEPFGADVTYNSDINGYLVRSPEAAKIEADAKARERAADAAQRTALERFNTLAAMRKAADASGTAETKAALEAAMKTALENYVGTLATPQQQQAQGAPGNAAPPATVSALCPADQLLRHGFQIMGPEGMRPYDQDSRLIMAMHASAKPLIATLNEYSNRMLKPKVNPADQLLPLARETTTIVQTQRALDRMTAKVAAGGETAPKVDDVFAAAVEAFNPETK